VTRSPYRSHEGRRVLEDWQSARRGGAVERPVRSDLGISVALDAGEGSGVPLVAFPGAGFPVVLLAEHLARLGESRRLVCVGVPGHPGLGLTRSADPRSGDLAVWADGLFDALDIDQADLFGHSAGGWAALRIAWERPHRVRRLVLGAPAGIVRARTPLRLLWRSLLWRIRGDDAGSRRVLEAIWGGGSPDPDLVAWTTLLARHTRRSPPPVRLPPPVLRAVEHPTLVLVGELDPVFPPPKLHAGVQRHFTAAHVDVVAGAGHVLPAEATDAVVDAASSFLA